MAECEHTDGCSAAVSLVIGVGKVEAVAHPPVTGPVGDTSLPVATTQTPRSRHAADAGLTVTCLTTRLVRQVTGQRSPR